MKHFLNPYAHAENLLQLLKWSALIIPPAILAGSASALFLWSLDYVTHLRWQNEWLLFLLPLAGLVVGCVYHWLGRSVEGGNNLIVDQIHEPGGGVPRRMAPLVLFGTLVTHLFGGSAGREGTAVQMGGSIASAFGRFFRIEPETTRVLLMSGVAAGFGSVFGTPLTGAVFAMEVLIIGQIQYQALIPVLIASVVGDLTCSAWGVKHAVYHLQFVDANAAAAFLRVSPMLLGKVVLAAIAFGLASLLFSELAHALQALFKKYISFAPLRPMIGGAIVIGLTFALGTRDFLGLGLNAPHEGMVTILSAFHPDGADTWSWFWKIIFTVVTLGSGFKGGEVTPLFFIGATLGNTLAWICNAPVDLFAALGFIAVFAGATNTPLACTIMGIELFGAQHAVYFATACFIAYFFSGHSGIYLSQRIGIPKKMQAEIPANIPLRDARQISHELAEAQLDSLSAPVGSFPNNANNERNTPMPHRHKVSPREIGLLRIYLKPSERRKTSGLKGLLPGRPLYRELVDAAKKDGIINAVAHHTHYGFSNSGKVQSQNPEFGNPDLTMCVELIGQKEQLDTFCRAHGEILKDKVIIYKHIEHWSVEASDVHAENATAKELRSE